jgi:hypothetical protein
MFVPQMKYTYESLRPVAGMALLFYMQMIFVPHRKHAVRLHGLLTGIALAIWHGAWNSIAYTYFSAAFSAIITNDTEGYWLHGALICGGRSECVRFEVFTAVTMKNDDFWDVTACGSCKNRRFGGT